jgi:hypothetical protein
LQAARRFVTPLVSTAWREAVARQQRKPTGHPPGRVSGEPDLVLHSPRLTDPPLVMGLPLLWINRRRCRGRQSPGRSARCPRTFPLLHRPLQAAREG